MCNYDFLVVDIFTISILFIVFLLGLLLREVDCKLKIIGTIIMLILYLFFALSFVYDKNFETRLTYVRYLKILDISKNKVITLDMEDKYKVYNTSDFSEVKKSSRKKIEYYSKYSLNLFGSEIRISGYSILYNNNSD